MIVPIFTPAELAEVKAYAWPHYLWLPLGVACDIAYAVLFLRFGVRPLYRLSERWAQVSGEKLRPLFRKPGLRVLPKVLTLLWGNDTWGSALIFATLAFALVRLVYLPVSVYFGFILEHRHGLSTESIGRFVADFLKGTGLTAVACAFLTLGLFGLMRRVRRWWLVLGVVAGLALILSAAVDPYRGRLYFEQSPLADGPLRTQLVSLLAKADVRFRDIVVEKTSVQSEKLNAYFAGQGPTRAIVLTDSLLARFTPDEVVAAVAHEAGHVHQHRWPSWAGSALALLLFLFLCDRLFRLAAARGWFGVREPADIRLSPLMTLLVMALTLVAMPVSAWASRERERDADRFALQVTGNRDAFVRMLVKAARVNKLDPDPPAWFAWSMSHPSIRERIAEAEGAE